MNQVFTFIQGFNHKPQGSSPTWVTREVRGQLEDPLFQDFYILDLIVGWKSIQASS